MNVQANGINQCWCLRIQGDAGFIADRLAYVDEMVFMIQMYRIKLGSPSKGTSQMVCIFFEKVCITTPTASNNLVLSDTQQRFYLYSGLRIHIGCCFSILD